MTKVSELPAGRELDALIAKVMGWTRIHRINSVEDFCGVPPQGAPPHVLPCYSTDIAAAFQIVDKLLDGTRAFVLKYGTRVFTLGCDTGAFTLGHWRLEADQWQAMFKGKLNEETMQFEQIIYAYAETRPLAICHAALKVVAEEKSGE